MNSPLCLIIHYVDYVANTHRFIPSNNFNRGHREGGAGGAMTLGPINFKGHMGLREAQRNDTEKLACEI